MSMNSAQISGWASEIRDNVGDTGISVAQVSTWLKTNLRKLNLTINSEFYFDTGVQMILPDMEMNQSGIYEEMYYCNYLDRKVNENLGAASYEWIEIQGEDQGKIRRASRTDSSKIYASQAKECQARMEKLITWYFNISNPMTPLQVLYNERLSNNEYGLLYPPEEFEVRSSNSVWSK